MFWNYYFIVNILITIIFFLNFKKKNLFFVIPFGFLFYFNFYYRDNLDVFKYYNLDLIYLLPSYTSSLIDYSSFVFSPYVNLFSQASTYEIISRNILLYFKINNVELYVLPFIFLIFYIFSLSKFLKSLNLSKKIFYIIFLTILISKISLYQNFHSYRLFLGLGYVLLVFSLYFKNLKNVEQVIKTNILLTFSLLFHNSLIIYILVFNLYLCLKKIKHKIFFLNIIALLFIYLSFSLIYREYISEILFYGLPGGKYILSKISWFGVDFTGTTSHEIYYLVNPLIVGIILFTINFIDHNKNKNDLELFTTISLLIIILFINNTFIWKRILYMFFPFYIILFYIYYNKILLKFSYIKFFSKFDLSYLLILNVFLLQIFSDFLDLKINSLYFVYMTMTILILKIANYTPATKNYNIFLFLPYLNISYLSLISLSYIDLYL